MGERACEQCGARFERTAPQQRFCRSGCREAAAAARRGGWYRKLGPAGGEYARKCATCSGDFTAVTPRRRYCSDRCKWRAKARRQHGHAPRVERSAACSVEGCDRSHLARGYCPGHYKAWRRAQGFPDAGEPGGGVRSARGHITRAKRMGVPWERFDATEVFERDRWVCGICGEPVDRSLAYPDPLSVSLDHVVPMVQGGGHLRENCQCSHLECNLRKERVRRTEALSGGGLDDVG